MLAKVKADRDLGTSVELVYLTGELIKGLKSSNRALERALAAIERRQEEQG
jgi:hypothetical protein